MAASAPDSEDTVGHTLEKRYADAAGFTIDVNPSMLQIWMLSEQLGEPRNKWLESVAQAAGLLSKPHDHWAHPLNVDVMSVSLRHGLRERATQKKATLPLTVVYPYDDMVKMIEAATAQRQTRMLGGSVGFPGMSSVLLLRRRTWQTPVPLPATTTTTTTLSPSSPPLPSSVHDDDDDDGGDEGGHVDDDAMDLDMHS